MTPLQLAAEQAWDEAGRMLAELNDVLVPLSGETVPGNEAAWDAFHAWERAVARAKAAQSLADHDDGVFNAWHGEAG